MAKSIKEQEINYDKNSLYFGYSARVSILIVLFTILAIICGLLAHKLINYQEQNNITLIELGKISHEVNLKKNSVYDKQVLTEKDKVTYVSSLIDSIKLNFDYKANFNKETIGEDNATIFGELTIYNPKSNNNYYIKKDILSNEKKIEFDSQKIIYINDVDIDYSKYNEMAKEFKTKYSKDAEAKLDVYLDLSTNLAPKDSKTFKRINSKLLVTIPLGKEEVQLINSPLDNTKVIEFKQPKTSIYSLVLQVLIILLMTFIIIVFIKLNSLLSKIEPRQSEYDRELKRILKEYDNIIVNVSILPDEREYKKVVIDDFDELLDLKDNVKEPIRFIEIAPHNKSYFFIKHNDEVFIYTLKNISRER